MGLGVLCEVPCVIDHGCCIACTIAVEAHHQNSIPSPLVLIPAKWLQIRHKGSTSALTSHPPPFITYPLLVPFLPSHYRQTTLYTMTNSPAKEKEDPMVGKAGTDAGAPKQQTGTEQRPGTSPRLERLSWKGLTCRCLWC